MSRPWPDGHVEALARIGSFVTHAERESSDMMWGAVTAAEAVEALAFITGVPADKLRLLCKTPPRRRVV